MLILQQKMGVNLPPVLGYTLWLDAQDESTLFSDHLGTVPAVVGGDVKFWADKSGNDYHASNNSSDVPTLRNGNIGTYNSLEFAPPDQLFNSTDNPVSASGGLTLFIVMLDTTVGDNLGSLFQFRRSNPSFIAQKSVSGISKYLYTDGVNTQNTGLTTSFEGVDFSNPHSMVFKSPGAGSKLKVFADDTEIIVYHGGGDLGSVATMTGTNGYTVANRADLPIYGWGGDIGEVVVYDSELNQSLQNAIQSWLYAKWGI